MANTPNLALPYPVPADTIDIPRDVKALADKLDGLGAWQNVGPGGPPFLNGWTNDTGSTLRFRKRPDGIVEFQGNIKGGTINQAVFTLPVGYRPMQYEIQPCAATNSISAQVQVDNTNGNVVVGFAAAVAWLSLNGVRFSTV